MSAAASAPEQSGRSQVRLRAVWGGLEVVFSRRLLRLLGHEPDEVADLAVRVLGLRHLAESAVMACVPRRPVYLGAAGIDVLHALSMIALARSSPSNRVICLASAATATGLAATALRAGRQADST